MLDRDALFAPGEGWAYADTNYVLLGAVLEKVGDAPCFDQIEKRLLQPLKLNDTAPNRAREVAGLANAHTTGLLGLPRGPLLHDGLYPVNPQFEYCGGGMASTTRDLARWGRALYVGEVVPKELRQAMLDGVPAKTGPGHRYGLGTMILETKHGRALCHSGLMPGYLSMLLYYETLDLAVAVQFNTDDQRKLGQGLQQHADDVAAAVMGVK